MIVYGSTLSPFVRKVMAFCAEKGIEPELKPAGLGRGGPEFEAASPFRKMPALVDGDYAIADSTAIVTYLDAQYPDPALIPADPRARGRTIWFDEVADTVFGGIVGRIFFNRFVAPKVLKTAGDLAIADAAERNELPPALDYLEAAVPDGGFLIGETITLADIAVASPFVNFAHVGVVIDADRYPRLLAYLARIHARPSFAGMIERERGMIAAMG